MRPPYTITPVILQLVSSISEKIGEVNANFLSKQSPQLRKQNRIKTIHSSLQIEGNRMTESQITALIENKRVIGPEKDVLEVLNAIKVYDRIEEFISGSEKSFLLAHKILMNSLINAPGKYRTRPVGILKGSKIAHVAPPPEKVLFLMKELFSYLKNENELPLIKSCVFHYEIEFIHPFMDGNGRMGRLWQTIILMEKYPVFEFLPFETLISQSQKEYYKSLAIADNSGNSTFFIEYMLAIIDKSLGELLNYNSRVMTDTDRIEYFIKAGIKEFSRKDYMGVFKHLSQATASRDLKKAVALKLFGKKGSQNKTVYYIK
jgi:Fic family protein